MKRSFQLIVSLACIGGSLTALADCTSCNQPAKRARRAADEVMQPMQTVPVAKPMAQPAAPMKMVPAEVKMAPVQAAQPKPAPVAAPVAAQPAESNKIELKSASDFDAHITKHTNVVAIFSATWCGPCQKLKPILEQLRNENKQVVFLHVDGDDFPGIISKHKIDGFPTLKFFKNGQEVYRTNEQSKEGLQSDINQHFLGGKPTFIMEDVIEVEEPAAKRMKVETAPMAAPAKVAPAPAPAPVKMAPAPAPVASSGNLINLAQAADFDGLVAKHSSLVAIFSTSWCGPCKSLKPVLEKLYAANPNVTFVYVDGDKFGGLVSKYASMGFPTLKFFKNGKAMGQAMGAQSQGELQSLIGSYLR